MKNIIITFSILYTTLMVSKEQELGNIALQNNVNPPSQFFQTNALVNTSNLNNDAKGNIIIFEQVNSIANNGSDFQSTQSNDFVKEVNKSAFVNGNDFDFSLNATSRSMSSVNSISKSHKRTFSKKLSKFKRKFYGKMLSHKKSKHLVDVCFNWTK